MLDVIKIAILTLAEYFNIFTEFFHFLLFASPISRRLRR